MAVACHLWPSISPWNIWELPLDHWLMFADNVDNYVKK